MVVPLIVVIIFLNNADLALFLNDSLSE
jgi:hypothetical protein